LVGGAPNERNARRLARDGDGGWRRGKAMQRNDLDSGAAPSMFLAPSVPARLPVGYKKGGVGESAFGEPTMEEDSAH